MTRLCVVILRHWVDLMIHFSEWVQTNIYIQLIFTSDPRIWRVYHGNIPTTDYPELGFKAILHLIAQCV